MPADRDLREDGPASTPQDAQLPRAKSGTPQAEEPPIEEPPWVSRSDYEELERELAGAMCDGLSMEGRYHEAVAEVASLRAALREAGQYEQVAADLALHLRSLCEHPANFEHRYEIRDGYPCPGCFDALVAFDALYRKSTEAGGE